MKRMLLTIVGQARQALGLIDKREDQTHPKQRFFT
jgi:hypothetical protein